MKGLELEQFVIGQLKAGKFTVESSIEQGLNNEVEILVLSEHNDIDDIMVKCDVQVTAYKFNEENTDSWGYDNVEIEVFDFWMFTEDGDVFFETLKEDAAHQIKEVIYSEFTN